MIPLEYSSMTPAEIAALNTREALNYFWSLPNENYFSPERLRLFEIVAWKARMYFTELPTIPAPFPISVIDVGCGPGIMLKTFSRVWPQFHRMVGIDWAESAIQQAMLNAPGGLYRALDLYDLDAYADDWFGEFQLVLCIEVLEHQNDWRLAMDQLHRLAKPGGHIIITVPNGAVDDWVGHRQFWTLEDLRRDFAQYGLVSAELIKDGTNILAHLRKPNATQ